MKPPLRNSSGSDLETAFRSSAEGLRAITRRVEGEQADLAQEACLKLVEAAEREPVLAPTHLLYRLARNLVIDRLRSRALKTGFLQTGEVDDRHACPQADPERALLANERLRRALALIEAMPLRRKEAFLLHRIDGLSYIEIARTMRITTKAVEKHISAAMLELTQKMQMNDFDR